MQCVYLLLPIGSTCVCSITVHRDWLKNKKSQPQTLWNQLKNGVCLSFRVLLVHLVFLGPEGNQGHRYVCVSVSEWAKLLMLGTCICMFVDVLPCFLDSVYLVILRKHYLYLRFSGRGDSVMEINVKLMSLNSSGFAYQHKQPLEQINLF